MNKKGFTIIELLAAITILGIISVIGITTITTYIKQSKTNFYKTQKNQLIVSTKSYLQSNRSLYPEHVGESTVVELKTLIKEKYISDVKDDLKQVCYLEDGSTHKKTYVRVVKENEKKYKYIPVLNCPNYQTTDTLSSTTPSTTSGNIKIIFSPPNLSVENFSTSFIVKDISTSQENIITTYKYKIMESDAINYEKTVQVNKKETTSGIIDLNEYTKEKQTQLKLEVEAYNSSGESKTEYTILRSNDLTGPKCPTISSGTLQTTKDKLRLVSPTGKVLIETRKEISAAPQEVLIRCEDTDSQGQKAECNNENYKLVINTDKEINKTVRIIDKRGNEQSCRIPKEMIRIDTTGPSCRNIKSSQVENKWTKENIKLTYEFTEDTKEYKEVINGSKSSIKKASTKEKVLTNEGEYRVSLEIYDNLRNKSVCTYPTKVWKIDKTPPTISWGGVDRYGKAKFVCHDNRSGVRQKEIFVQATGSNYSTSNLSATCEDQATLKKSLTKTVTRNLYCNKIYKKPIYDTRPIYGIVKEKRYSNRFTLAGGACLGIANGPGESGPFLDNNLKTCYYLVEVTTIIDYESYLAGYNDICTEYGWR